MLCVDSTDASSLLARCEGPTVVLEQGADAGVLQEPGRPHVSIRRNNRVRGSGHNPRPPEARSPTVGANIERTDGTGHTRDDRSAPGRAWGVVAPRYDRRSGGTDPRDPAEERGEPGHGLSRESGRRDQELTNSLPEWLDSEERWVRIRGDIWASNLQRTHGSKNRMRKTCTSGSVRARGWATPPGYSATRLRPGKAGRKGMGHAVIHEISSSRPAGAKPARSKPSPAGR